MSRHQDNNPWVRPLLIIVLAVIGSTAVFAPRTDAVADIVVTDREDAVVEKDGDQEATGLDQTQAESITPAVGGGFEVKSCLFEPPSPWLFSELAGVSAGGNNHFDTVPGFDQIPYVIQKDSSDEIQLTWIVTDMPSANGWPLIVEGNLHRPGGGSGPGTVPLAHWGAKINLDGESPEIHRDEDGGAVAYKKLTEAQSVAGKKHSDALPGQKINLKFVYTPPPGKFITGYTWTLDGDTFKDWTANQTTGTLTELDAAADQSSETVHFYWTDAGAKTVKCVARRNDGVDITIEETINVDAPTPTLNRTLGAAGFNGAVTAVGCYGPGISFTGRVTMPAGWPAGEWNWVQLVTPNLKITLTGGVVQQSTLFGQQVLDTTYPYEPAPYTAHPGTAGSYATHATTTHTDTDSPQRGLAGNEKVEYLTPTFRTTLMFLPPGPNSRYVPTLFFNWDFTVTARWVVAPLPGWVTDPGKTQSATVPAATTTHPTWTDVVTNERYVSDDLTVTITPASVTEGDGAVAGMATVSVTNNVTADTVVNLASSDTTELTVPATVTILAGTNSIGFTITVVDDADADGDQTVTVTGSHANYGDGSDDVIVEDNEADAPEISVSPAALSFPDRAIGDGPTNTQDVVITNDGTGDLTITSVALNGAGAGEFGVFSDTGEGTLAPGASRTVKVYFDPTAVGAKTASLRIASDDADEGTVDVTLSGTGTN